MEAKTERKSFPEAVRILLDILESGDAYSISQLSRKTDLNRRTVEKALNLLSEAQKYFGERKLEVTEIRHMKIVSFGKKSGLLDLPEELQKLIIRTVYYPNPSREEEILVYVNNQKAFSPERSIKMEESSLVKKLLEQGQLMRALTKGTVYLSNEGKIVAEGALELYPELKNLQIHLA